MTHRSTARPATLRVRWRRAERVVRTTPASERPNPWAAYRLERIRAPRRGLDNGLYVVRSPDGVTRAGLVRGLHTRSTTTPHRVVPVDGLDLGADVVRFWPMGLRRIPTSIDLRDAFGDVRAALRATYELARERYDAATTTTED